MSAAYLYGPGGMRESKSVTTEGVTRTTQSVWSGMTLVAERDSDGTRYEYIYGVGVPLEIVVTPSGGASERFGWQVDAAGSVIGITDEDGTVIANYAYDPYGVPTATSGTDPLASRNPLRYRGYYYDNETGLYYLPARYYEPRSARFLSVDPAPPEAGDPMSLNRYAYCLGDPVNASDPTGAVTDMEADSWKHYRKKFNGNSKLARKANSRFRHAMNYRRRRRWSDRRKGSRMLQAQAAHESALLASAAVLRVSDFDGLRSAEYQPPQSHMTITVTIADGAGAGGVAGVILDTRSGLYSLNGGGFVTGPSASVGFTGAPVSEGINSSVDYISPCGLGGSLGRGGQGENAADFGEVLLGWPQGYSATTYNVRPILEW